MYDAKADKRESGHNPRKNKKKTGNELEVPSKTRSQLINQLCVQGFFIINFLYQYVLNKNI